MRTLRIPPSLLAALLALSLFSGCSPLLITSADIASEPTVFCKVDSPPDPTLLGYWRRLPPGEFNRPHVFNYWLVRKGDRYALFYHWDDKRGKVVRGWFPFVLDGSRMTSSEDPSAFFVKDGQVFHNYGGRPLNSPMMKVKN
jgi:hypothetical protein